MAVPLVLATLYSTCRLAPLLLEPQLDSSSYEVRAGKKNVVVLLDPELLPSSDEPVLEHEGRADLTLDVFLEQGRRLDSLSSPLKPGTKLPSVGYFSPARTSRGGEPCRTSFSLVPSHTGPPPTALHVRFFEQSRSNRFRWLLIRPDGGDLELSVTTEIPLTPEGLPVPQSSLGLGCRKSIQIGEGKPKRVPAGQEYPFLAAAGSWITIKFERLRGQDPPWEDRGPFQPFYELPLPVHGLEKRSAASDPRSPEIHIAGAGPGRTLQLDDLALMPDGLSLSVSGEGTISGTEIDIVDIVGSVTSGGASGWGMLAALLLASGGAVAAAWWWVAAGQAPVRVFVSYSHKNRASLLDLIKFLETVTLDGVEIWWDRKILAADPWDAVIRRRIQRSDILVALVSPTFLESRYCQDVEIRGFLARSAVLFPVILAPCDWRSQEWLSRLQVIPLDGTTLEDYRRSGDLTTPYLEILECLRQQAGRIRGDDAAEP